ncbi:hypothetical protein RhoFasK5_03189|nr:hypothetical protein [Rhodococcus kroppenstedtii]
MRASRAAPLATAASGSVVVTRGTSTVSATASTTAGTNAPPPITAAASGRADSPWRTIAVSTRSVTAERKTRSGAASASSRSARVTVTVSPPGRSTLLLSAEDSCSFAVVRRAATSARSSTCTAGSRDSTVAARARSTTRPLITSVRVLARTVPSTWSTTLTEVPLAPTSTSRMWPNRATSPVCRSQHSAASMSVTRLSPEREASCLRNAASRGRVRDDGRCATPTRGRSAAPSRSRWSVARASEVVTSSAGSERTPSTVRVR